MNNMLRNYPKLIVFLFISIACINISNAEPITFKSVNMTMTIDEIVKVLSKDFKCEKYMSGKGGFCENEERNIVASIRHDVYGGEKNDRIEFSCRSYGGCTFSFDEVLSQVSNFTGTQMDSFEEVNGHFAQCGRGKEGDKICLLDNFNDIYLIRSNLGSKGMNMN